MKLYHFTANHHVEGGAGHAGPGVRSVGFLPNAHPLIGLPPGVWLTEDGSWSQFWSSRPVPGIGCDRTEVRLAVVIPQASRDRLLTYERIRPFVRPDWREDFEGGFDLAPWRLYLGRIPFSWVRDSTSRPASDSHPGAVRARPGASIVDPLDATTARRIQAGSGGRSTAAGVAVLPPAD